MMRESWKKNLRLQCRRLQCRRLLLLVMMGTLSAVAVAQEATDFSVPAQDAASGLRAMALQGKFEVMIPPELVKGHSIKPVQGHYTSDTALNLALQGSGLVYKAVSPGTYAIQAGESDPSPFAGSLGAPAAIVDNGEPPGTEGAVTGAEVAPPLSSKGQQPSNEDSGNTKDRSQELGQVVVVASRLPQTERDSAVPVSVYTQEKIEQSGTSTVTEFLNTLPEVSVQTTTTSGVQQTTGGTTVQLRGLPAGTTLILLNGRRTEGSTGVQGGAGGFLDLNQIPLSAVERIEVLPTGSSAIYGGDGLGGVINIVLKQGFKGMEMDARYGATTDGKYNESNVSLAMGWKTDKWSLSMIALFADNSELSANERAITANNNYTAFGGLDYRYAYGDPGNVCSANGQNLTGLSAPCAGIPKGSTGVGLTPASFQQTAGMLNETSLNAQLSLLSPGDHYATYLSGTYELGGGIQAFAEVLYNHARLNAEASSPLTTLSVPASNQYNPFGQDVTVAYEFTALGRKCVCQENDFFRPLVGLRGAILDKWNWEVAAWTSRDWENDPETLEVQNSAAITSALANGTFNPFQDGPGGSSSVINGFFSPQAASYKGATDSVNGFVNGPVVQLASGTVEGVIGGEYQRDTLGAEVPSSTASTFDIHRETEAGFAELKVPIIGNHAHPGYGDYASAQLAVRYDQYSDFGGRTSPLAGLEIRPLQSLLIRASFSSAFKPPTLYDLYAPTRTYVNEAEVTDPLRGGQQEIVSFTIGGNPKLKPETGWSRNIGVVFSPEHVKNLDVTLTSWGIHIKNGFIDPAFQAIVDNEQADPGLVTRAPPSPGDQYAVGLITSLDDSFINFGSIDEAGLDFRVDWHRRTPVGEFSPYLAITETYRYVFDLTQGAPPSEAVSAANDSADYSPRWKGVTGLNWKKDLIQLDIDGRYTGWYQDVTDLTSTPRELGNFWYFDADAKYEAGRQLAPGSKYLSKIVLSGGIRNMFNKLPPYSDYLYGQAGYDPNEYDIQGRFIWIRASAKF